jgi:hypothetical protein
MTNISTPRQWARRISVFVLFLALAVGLQYRNGAYQSGFGSHPDEPAHFVTGLMVHDYLRTGIGTSPMPFAERFYAHYPAVAFGHWPPILYVIQALWGFLFGMSRSSGLLLIAAIGAITSTCLAYVAGSAFGRTYGALAGLCFLVLPTVQLASDTFMADIPVTMFAFLAVMSCVRLVQLPTLRNALLCGLAVSTAILVKGNGWALIPVVAGLLLLVKSPVSFALRRLSIVATIVLVACVPLTLSTIKMTQDGWEQNVPSVSFFLRALPVLVQYQIALVGVVLAGLAVFGVYPAFKRVRLPEYPLLLCRVHLLVVASVLLFHALTPTSLEPRKLLLCMPSLLVLSVAGLRRIASIGTLPGHWAEWGIPAIAGLVVAGVNIANPVPPTRHANLGPAAAFVIANKALEDSAVLVVSSSADWREELSFVAEVAERTHGQFSKAIVRAGKLLADSSWLGREYTLRYTDSSNLDNLLRSIPIAAIVLYTEGSFRNPHSALMERYLANAGPEWALINSRPSGNGQVQTFLCTHRPSKSVELPSIDLTRKLGRSINAKF